MPKQTVSSSCSGGRQGGARERDGIARHWIGVWMLDEATRVQEQAPWRGGEASLAGPRTQTWNTGRVI